MIKHRIFHRLTVRLPSSRLDAKISFVGLVVALASVSPTKSFAQSSRPVSARDISGKTICWSDGTRSTYAANGQYVNNQGAHRVWSVTPGVIHVGSVEREAEVLPDGRLHSYYVASPRGGAQGLRREYWGTACD